MATLTAARPPLLTTAAALVAAVVVAGSPPAVAEAGAGAATAPTASSSGGPSVGAAAADPVARAAAAGAGKVQLKLAGKGRAARGMRAERVRTVALGAARKRGARIVLPVAAIAVKRTARVRLRGGIAFRHGRRRVALSGLQVVVAPRQAKLTARLGKRRLPLFVARPARGRAKLDRADTTARLARGRLSLTPRAARVLRKRLSLDRLPAGPLGALGLRARAKPGSTPEGDGGGDTGPTTPGGGGGPTGPGGPQSEPIENEPPLLARPATAVDASNVAITWYPRDSWVRYLSSGTGPQDGIFATGGASKGAPPTETGAHPCFDVDYTGSGTFDYELHYAPKSGWYDPASGTAALYGQGQIRFRWESHTIDLAAADPEIEINGAASRAIFRFEGTGGTAYDSQRAVLVNLDQAGQPTASGGGSFTYEAMRGALTDDGAGVFAGFYPAGGPFGCVSVSFTAP